jgi:hypothetical protein
MSCIIEDLKNNSTPLIEKAIEEIESLERELVDSTEGYELLFKKNGELKDRIEAIEKASQWQPIETAPKDGTEILVFFKSVGIKSVSWTDTDWDSSGEYALWCVDDNKFAPHPLRGYSSGDEMCWMPLPQPPAIAGESK